MSVQYQISIHISLFTISVINITTKTNLERKGFIWLHILITVHHKGRSERRNRNHRGKLLISLLPCHKEPYPPGTVSPTKFPSHKLWWFISKQWEDGVFYRFVFKVMSRTDLWQDLLTYMLKIFPIRKVNSRIEGGRDLKWHLWSFRYTSLLFHYSAVLFSIFPMLGGWYMQWVDFLGLIYVLHGPGTLWLWFPLSIRAIP